MAQPKRSYIHVWIIAILLALAGGAVSIWQLQTSFDARMEASGKLVLSLSNAAAHRIADTLARVDTLLAETTDAITDPVQVPAQFLTALRLQASKLPNVDKISIVDANGMLCHVALLRPPARSPLLPTDISSSPHFAFQKKHFQDRHMFLSPPLANSITERVVLLASRPLVNGSGQFAGIVSLSIEQTFIADTLRSVLSAPDDAAAVFSPQGILFLRQPDTGSQGQSISESSLFHAYTQIRSSGWAAQAMSFADKVDRIVGFTPIPGYPLVAAVGISRQAALQAWHQEIAVHGGIQVVFSGGLFLLSWGLIRSEKRKERLRQKLARQERDQILTLEHAVTERTQALNDSLAALGESEERFRKMIEIFPQPLTLTRCQDKVVVYINSQAADTFGVPVENAEGKIASDYWESPALRDEFLSRLREEGKIRDFEATLRRQNGEFFRALLSGTIVQLKREDLVLISLVDITVRKKLEDELARSNADLEQFSYAVSHDLQEPLRMISSYLALLERRCGDNLGTDAKEFIGFAVDGAKRLSHMISDLLDFSRVHRKGAHFRPVALDHALDEALTNLSASIDAAGATIHTATLPQVIGDASQLMRVFQNLIGNALKYRKAETPPEIRVDARLEGTTWLFSVIDNGIGIDPAHSARVFQVFQRLHARDQYEGSGIGLALCRRIIERHGGNIWLESVGEGQGCTFHFTLPSVTEPQGTES